MLKRIITLILSITIIIPNISFAKEDNVTREFLIHKLVRVTDILPSENSILERFTDNNQIEEEYKQSVAIAVENNFINGYEDGTLKPKSLITRIEAFSVLARIIPKSVYPPNNAVGKVFNDVPSWAEKDISFLTKLELVSGYDSNLIGANDKITTEQVIILANRIKKFFPKREQDDFYFDKNKEWLKNAQINYSQNSTSLFHEVSSKAYNKYNYGYSNFKNMVLDKDRTEFSKYMTGGTGRINGIDTEFCIDSLKKIYNAMDLNELSTATAETNRDFMVPSIVNIGVAGDLADKNIGALYIAQPNLMLGDDYYYNGPNAEEIKKRYIYYVKSILTQMKNLMEIEFEDEEIEASANKIYEMQKDISKYVENPSSLQNTLNEKDGTSMETVKALFGDFNVENFLEIMGVPKVDKAIVLQKEALSNFTKYLNMDNLQLLKDYVICCFFDYYGGSLNGYNSYYNFLYGYGEQLTKVEKRPGAVTDYRNEMNIPKVQYVEKIFNELKDVYQEQITDSPYVSESFKNETVSKFKKMKIIVGENPIGIYKWFEEYLDNATPFKENYKRYNDLMKFINKKIIGQIGKEIIYDETPFEASLVNAYYNRISNTINIPYGILESPFYSEYATEEENLAGIGFVIGHELGHSIDFGASIIDSDGNVRDFLTNEDKAHFNDIKTKLGTQFSNYEIEGIGKTNGYKTLDENICDILSLNCIIKYAKGKELSTKTIFENYPVIWREKGYQDFYEYALYSSEHSIGKLRVNGILPHIDEFYEIYNVEEGDNLYLNKEDRVSIY